MLCNTCQSINFDEARLPDHSFEFTTCYKHHPRIKDLEEAADSGCDLCRLIATTASGGFRKDDQIYCWVHTIFNFNSVRKELEPLQPQGCSMISFLQHKVNDPRSPEIQAQFSLFALEGSPAARSHSVSGRQIDARAESDASIRKVKDWINNCLTSHRICCPWKRNLELPSRFIDVGRADGSSEPVLCINTAHQTGEWISLSYCWGTKGENLLLTNGKIKDMQASLPLSEFPKTIRDAVIMTRLLGYRFLWVDSLCILQDSQEDWVAESSRMGDYYRGSILTLAADSAVSASTGFLSKRCLVAARNCKEFEPIEVPFNSSVSKELSSFFIRPIPRSPRIGQPMSERAWVVQEDILSPRTLRFTPQGLVWECQQTEILEFDDSPVQNSKSIKRRFLVPLPVTNLRPTIDTEDFLKPKQILGPCDRWYNIVSEFMNRKITFHSDRLPAISALAREIALQTGFTYMAGLWKEDIHQGLLWSAKGRGSTPLTYRAPSWSWASLDISPGRDLASHRKEPYALRIWHGTKKYGFQAHLLDYHVQTLDSDQYGRIVSGYIKIHGPWMVASDWKGFYEPIFGSRGREAVTYIGASHLCITLDEIPIEDLKKDPDMLVLRRAPHSTLRDLSSMFLLQISQASFGGLDGFWYEKNIFCLVLKQTETEGTFRRIGVAEISSHADERHLLGWERKTVIII